MLEGTTIYDDQAAIDIANMGRKQAIVLFFIGGITYGEIAAIRYLAKTYSNHSFHLITNRLPIRP